MKNKGFSVFIAQTSELFKVLAFRDSYNQLNILVSCFLFCYQVSRGLWKKYGDKRIIDTPISEVSL